MSLAALPLAGVRIIDLTSNMSGPLATMVLADQGADVVKIEPLTGDAIRTVGTGHAGMSAYFANVNRAMRSVAVDLRAPAGKALVERLVGEADVFVQNFRHGVADRLGLGPDALLAANPRLIYASVSGFGTEGPLADAPAYDHVVQALSGIAALQSDGGEPAMIRHGAIDKATAYTTAQAITAALFARTSSGVGTRIDVSMLDVAVAFLWPDGMMDQTVLEPDSVLPPTSRSFRLTPTADGLVSLVTLTGAQWAKLTEALADESDSAGDDLSDTSARMARGGEVMRQVRAKIAQLPTDEVVARLRAADVPCAPVVGVEDVWKQPQVVASDTVASFDHAVLGPVRQARPAARFDGERSPTVPSAPRLGEHADEVLLAAGWTEAEVAELRSTGVVL
jgi:crotonobetainyl-CoA:carnitine CoA-transferase CaiB-like acyl-CoA transferase